MLARLPRGLEEPTAWPLGGVSDRRWVVRHQRPHLDCALGEAFTPARVRARLAAVPADWQVVYLAHVNVRGGMLMHPEQPSVAPLPR